ncbi:MAG: amidohydrolase family protein [Chloroflexi bacterium]|nr:amidohydrolase family protein [Chloroflexota bacterium]
MNALIHGSLIDGTGADPVSDATIVIDDDGRITGVGAGIEVPRCADVIDVSGRTIMPGLIDCHVHLFLQLGDMQNDALTPLSTRVFEAAERAGRTLDAGVTSIRDIGGTPRGFKLAAQRGMFASPRMNIAVSIISQTGGHGDYSLPSGVTHPWFAAMLEYEPEWPNSVCDGVEGVTRTARETFRAGADFLKICTTGGLSLPNEDPEHTQFTIEEIRTFVVEAKARGSYVAAHAQGLQGIKNALQGGVRTIEHGYYMDEEAADQMVEQQTFLVPTAHLTNGRLRRESADAGSVPEDVIARSKIVAANLKMASAKGVKIAMGTDVGVAEHGTNAEDLTALVDITGMSPMQAIVAATQTASECNRTASEVGTLEPGKLADLLVVDGDPLADISMLEDKSTLLMIMQGGNAHKDLITS